MSASGAPRRATDPAEKSSSYAQAAVAPPAPLPTPNMDPPPSAVRAQVAPALPIIPTTQQAQISGTAHTTHSGVNTNTATALAIPVSHYERKARQTHQAMFDIHHGGYSFAETAECYGLTVEELGRDFATFGSQAAEVAKQRNVYVDTMYRAMGLNKSGHSTDIEHALPKAMRQKRAETEGRFLNTERGRQGGPSHRRPGPGARDVKPREKVAMPRRWLDRELESAD